MLDTSFKCGSQMQRQLLAWQRGLYSLLILTLSLASIVASLVLCLLVLIFVLQLLGHRQCSWPCICAAVLIGKQAGSALPALLSWQCFCVTDALTTLACA